MSGGGTAAEQHSPGATDPFDTARLRRGVLEAWTTSAARFREDANAEQELVLGGYRDRLVVELAQNAADAAARAGVPGELRLTLSGDVLVAANTGAPLDAPGVESLSTLRASAKRDDSAADAVGRFGVGFSAVLAVTDEPAVVSRAGGVRWSLTEARELVHRAAEAEPAASESAASGAAASGAAPSASDPSEEAGAEGTGGDLSAELRRRGGHVPLLRLPFPASAPEGTLPDGSLPDGYETAVLLPLRDTAARELAERLLTAVDDALLLALPGLARVTVETEDGRRELTRHSEDPAGRSVRIEDSVAGATRWRLTTASGRAEPELLADRPLEERERPQWTVTWAVPLASGGQPEGAPAPPRTAPRVHAPTPTDEPLGLPALLIASFPLEPTRRRVAPGPLTDFLLVRAAEAYVRLLREWQPVTTGVLDLVPGMLGQGELDGALRALVLERLPRTRFLPAAAPGGPSAPSAAPPSEMPAEFATEAATVPAEAEPAASASPTSPTVPPTEAPAEFATEGFTPPSETSEISETSAVPLDGDTVDADGAAPPHALRPVDAELLEGGSSATVTVLAELFPNLLPAGLESRTELRTLEVARVPLGEMVDRLAGVERAPEWWLRLYESLAGTDPDRLSGLPVPLAGDEGRTAIGPRQVLLPLSDEGHAGAEDGTDRHATFQRLGLKVAHPEAVHPLLEKLGATRATPRAVLTTPQVRAAVARSREDADSEWADTGPVAAGLDAGGPDAGGPDAGGPDVEELAETVLGLARDAGLAPGDEPWLGALALPDDEGYLTPAAELLYPGSDFQRIVYEGELAPCEEELTERWGEQPLTAVGVQSGFSLVRATDVVLDPDELVPYSEDFPEPDDVGYLDAIEVWCEDVLDQLPDTPVPPVAAEMTAVRDLDLVDDDHWPEALAMLAQPPLRDALTASVRVLLPDGTTRTVRPYTAWWLRGQPVLDGRRPAGLRAAGSDPLLAGLYEEADASTVTDAQVLHALGVRTSAEALLAEPGGAAELLARLADPTSEVTPEQLHGLYGLLATLDPNEVTLPDELRAVRASAHEPPTPRYADAAGESGGESTALNVTTRVVEAAEVLVADAPDLLPLAGDHPLLPVGPSLAADLAGLLEVPRLSEAIEGTVAETGAERPVPQAVRTLLPSAPDTYREHEELLVDGVQLDWRYLPADHLLHAATLEGLAAGLAWAAGEWARRFEVAALLEDPTRANELSRARWFDETAG